MDVNSDNADLSVKQQKIIQDTWKPIIAEVKVKSVNLFVELLSAYPAYNSVFGIKKGENLKENKLLKAHSETAVLFMSYLIEHALGDPVLFEAFVINLARNHVKKPVDPIHIKNFNSVLLNYLRNSFGKQMVPAIEQAWVTLLDKINEVVRITLLSERGLLVNEKDKLNKKKFI